MDPKKQGKSHVSKGIVGRPKRTPATGTEKILNKVRAWKAGKPVKIFYNNEWVQATEVWGPPFEKTSMKIKDESDDI